MSMVIARREDALSNIHPVLTDSDSHVLVWKNPAAMCSSRWRWVCLLFRHLQGTGIFIVVELPPDHLISLECINSAIIPVQKWFGLAVMLKTIDDTCLRWVLFICWILKNDHINLSGVHRLFRGRKHARLYFLWPGPILIHSHKYKPCNQIPAVTTSGKNFPTPWATQRATLPKGANYPVIRRSRNNIAGCSVRNADRCS